MEENTNVQAVDEEITFDPSDFPDFSDDGNHTEEPENTEEQQTEEVTSEPTETTTETTEPTETAEQPPANQPEMFELNYMGTVQKHTREEMIALAQMGMDRDRILQQRDAAMQFRTQHEADIANLEQMAKDFGMENPAALLDAMRINLLRQQGKTQAEAEAIVRADNANRQLQGYQTQEQRMKEQQEAAHKRQQEDINEFVRRYPNVDIRTLPMEVQDAVFGRGETLVNAYGRYEMQQLRAENQRLQQQINAQKQNDENKQKSLGSMKSGSATPKLDDFMMGFNEE